MYELLKEFIKPELLSLVPVLFLIGAAIKTSKLRDKHIPWILGTLGVILSGVWVCANSPLGSVREVLIAGFTAFTQGILAAGASVYVHQLYKQAKKPE